MQIESWMSFSVTTAGKKNIKEKEQILSAFWGDSPKKKTLIFDKLLKQNSV